MAKTPEIQVDALLNLVLDENTLKSALGRSLGTSVKEAAKNVNLGDALASPQNLKAIRDRLKSTFQEAGRDLAQGMNMAQSEGLKQLLDRTRRDTIKAFDKDLDNLLNGKGLQGTRGRASLAPLSEEVRKELQQAVRVFGRESLRSGSYQGREADLTRAQRNVGEINKLMTELAGLPAVAAKDLQRLRTLVNNPDTGKYLKMQKEERAGLARSSQALQLQTQTLGRMASSLSRMGFGDIATEIRAANQARKSLVSDYNRISSPDKVEARARAERRVTERTERQLEQAQRRALRSEIRQREAEQRAQGSYQTIFGARRAGQVSPGIAATMDSATRARMGLPPREDARARSLRDMAPSAEQRRLNAWFNSSDRSSASPLNQVQQNISRAAATRLAAQQREQEAQLARYNDGIKRQGDAQLAQMAAFRKQQERIQEASLRGERQAQEAQQRARANYARQTASYSDAMRIANGVGGIGRLSDATDIGIVRGGLTSAYRQAQQRLNLAGTTAGQDTQQYRAALNDLNNIRAQRDQLAGRIREIRAGGGGAGGAGGAGGRGGASGEYSTAGNLLGTFSRYAIGYGGLYQVLGAVVSLKNEIIELDRAFFSIKAVTQATDVEMQSISRSIREVALNTNFTTREIAGAAEILGQAGVTPADMDKVLSATAQFASATNSSLSLAADLMTTVRTVFKEMDELTIADQLTRAVNLSKLTAQDLQTILSLTSQTASSYNVNLQQLLSAVTTLRNAGIKPSTVATGLRQAMLEIFNPDTATMKALSARYGQMGEEITGEGISQRFFGFTNAANPLLAALTELRRIGFNDEGQKTLQRGVDIRAFNAIQGLLANFKELEEAESKITFGQAAAEGAEIQMRSLSATLENLGASVTVLAEQMSHGLVRQLAAGAKEATNLIERLTELDLEMKATGQGSLNQILTGALAGGVAGAATGTGFRSRALGAATGAVSGGYLAGGYNLDEGEGLSAVDVAGIVATVLALGRLMKWIGAISKGLGGAAGVLGGARAGAAVGGAAAGLGTVASIGSKLIPVIGWVTTAVTVISLLSDMLDSDEASRLKARAEAAANQASSARKALESNTSTVESFDPNSAAPKAGTAAEGFSRYRDQVENFGLNLEQTFGEAAAGKAQELGDALREYAQMTFTQRQSGNAKAQLERILGAPLAEGIDDKILFDLGVQREAIDATVQAFVDNTRQTINSVTERIRAARESGDQVTAFDQAMSDAFSENAAELQAIIDGRSNLNPEKTQEALMSFYARFTELIDDRPALEAEARVKSMNALADQLAQALANSNNEAEIAQAVSQIANGLEYISLSTQDRLNSILRGLATRRDLIQKEIAELEGQRPDILHRGTTALWRAMGSPNEMAETAEAERTGRLSMLRSQLGSLDTTQGNMVEQFAEQERQRQARNEETRRQSATRAANLISGFNDPDGRISSALSNPQMLRDVQLTPQQIKYLTDNREAILGGDADLLGRLASTETKAGGDTEMGAEFKGLEKSFNLLAANLSRVTEAQLRAERDQGNMVTGDMLRRQSEAETAIKKADYGKDYALLASDTANNPVVQLFAAQREILEKELAQAKSKMDDAKEDGSKTAVAREQAVIEAQAKLDNLDLEKAQELEKFGARLRTQGEQAQRKADAAQRKADAEAKKQATIAVTQTGIEQRLVKQDFDEAIRVGDSAGFLALSRKYEEVQAKLREQLETELKARGYNADQILAEIKLREDLNKPLAEQVANIRKLQTQRASARDLEFRDVGSGPNLGSKFNTAYLGVDGFTTEEQMAAATRDLVGLQARRAQIMADQANPIFAADQQSAEKLAKELDEVNSQLGATSATLDRMARTPAGSIYAAFSPRNLILELERSQYSFENMGDNLRSSLGGAINEIGQGLANAINQGEKFSDVLQQIINQAATNALGDIFQTNINEGLKGLITGATGDKNGQGGGIGGIWNAAKNGFSNFFGFGGSKDSAAGGGESKGLLGTIGGWFGLGGDGDSTAGGSDMSTGSMVVNAASVTVNGPGMGGVSSLLGGAEQAKDVAGEVNKAVKGEGGILSSIQGMFTGASDWISGLFGGGSSGGSWGGGGGGLSGLLGGIMGMFGGGAGGGGFTSLMGNLFSSKNDGRTSTGTKGGGWANTLARIGMAYFTGGFGAAGGGSIDSKGRVRGSGKKGVDSVPVVVKGTGQMGLLAPGEGILTAKAMDVLGSDFLDAANTGKLFTKAVGGVIDGSYNATERAAASARNSVARSSGNSGGDGVTVNLKNVNITDKSEVFAAMQTREGEDLMINRLKARGAL